MAIVGETNLPALLRTMQPALAAQPYVFCTVAATFPVPFAEVLGFFREGEGITIILRQELADQLGLPYDLVMAWLTLTVHSSLAAVGLTAAVAQALTAEHISCNVVAAYYHDHLFVAQADADRALVTLRQLAARHQDGNLAVEICRRSFTQHQAATRWWSLTKWFRAK